jgi:deferrochelatase/peroxidase EfeB
MDTEIKQKDRKRVREDLREDTDKKEKMVRRNVPYPKRMMRRG